jgi:hypothetical protein
MRIIIASIFLVIVTTAKAQTTNHQVYALYVVNIAKYSSWPGAETELHIVVLGKSKVFDELQKQNGKTVNGKHLKIEQFEDYSRIGEPHILYVSDGKSNNLDEILQQTQGKSIMIVAEREGLFRKGAGFSFIIMENNILKFDVNSSELEKRQIKVSKSLTSLANSTL